MWATLTFQWGAVTLQSCLSEGENTGASTDIYDAVVGREEARREGHVLYLTGVKSRRPPAKEPNWHTSYRLQCAGLVGLVPLRAQGMELQRTDAVYWGEIVPSFRAQPGQFTSESQFRQQGRVAVRLLSRGDLPTMEHDPDIALQTPVALIDLRVFVPEVICVLATFARADFAAHLAAIPFARRLIGLDPSPQLLRLAPEAEIKDYVWTALCRSEIASIVMLTLEEKTEAFQKIMALPPVKTLYGTQLEAFASALCSALHCTQGPPGTGKV
jgi:hypothetical protein